MHEQYNPFVGESSRENADQLLPTNVKPTSYDIRLRPDLDDASLEGSVIIHLDVLNQSTFILLNSDEQDLLTTEIVDMSGNVTKIPKVLYDETQQTMMVPLPTPIQGESKIQLLQTFKGRLNDTKTNSGFNRSMYKGSDGKLKT